MGFCAKGFPWGGGDTAVFVSAAVAFLRQQMPQLNS